MRRYQGAHTSLLVLMWIAYTPDGVVRRPYRSLGPAAAYLLMALVGVAIRTPGTR